MKQKLSGLLLLLLLATANLQAQEIDSTFVPDYGIELEGYSETKRFAADTWDLETEIKFMYPKFTEKKVYFFYNIKTYNDSLLVRSKNNYVIT